jgi:hypothetical protein
MPLSLLDGTSGQVDFGVAFSGTTTTSMKCVIASAEYRSTRGFQDQTTLCSGKWISESPTRNQDFLTITKFASQGSTISDTSVLMVATNAATITATFGTGLTKTGTFWLDTDSISVNAGSAAMPGQLSFRSSGAVATVWVTS